MFTSTRTILEQVVITERPERVFQALVTPSDICGWWKAHSAVVFPKKDGIWVASWGQDGDDPDYMTKAKLEVFEPPHKLVLTEFDYYSKDGPLPFEARMETEFVVQPHESGSLLSVCQSGFPSDSVADEFFAGCQQGWCDTLNSMAQYFS